jgi:2,5-diketo-D-gluconate reductase B
VVLEAIELGYRLIDTAVRYNNEEAVGAAIAAASVPRDELIVSTKLPLECTTTMVAKHARASLGRLGVDYLDLLLMHWPNKKVPQEETLYAMAQLREEGLVRWVGVSNFTAPQVQRALTVTPLLTNQIEYHPYLDQALALEIAEREDLLITAYSPLADGRALKDPVITDIAARHGVSAGQVTLRWLVQQDRVVTIPKTATSARLRENLDVFGFELTADEMRVISAMAEGHRTMNPAFAPTWDDAPGFRESRRR